MKLILSLFVMLTTFQICLAQRPNKFENYVASIKKGKIVINESHLRKKTPSGESIVNFRILSSKKGTNRYLVQEIKAHKGRVNRYIPLKEENGMLYADLERSTSFVDCWLMECSTCEEVVSQTGAVWCECSVGGCENADTSDPVRDIVEYLHQ